MPSSEEKPVSDSPPVQEEEETASETVPPTTHTSTSTSTSTTTAAAAAPPAKKTVTPPVMPADWAKLGCDTGPVIRYPTDVADVDVWDAAETDCIVLVGTSGQKLTHLGPDFGSALHPGLKQLILRSHMLAKMEGLEPFRALELLELYDNQIEVLQCLESFAPNLRVLDMSYNAIRDMGAVRACPNLQELYLANNKLKAIDGLDGLTKLRKLDLGANRIRLLPAEELAGLTSLEELWLGKNKIESMDGLEALSSKVLRRMDLQSNRLVKIDALPDHIIETLEEFYLADNGIDTDGLVGLSAGIFPVLNVLDLSKNRLTNCAPLSHLASLEEVWLSGNRVGSWDEVEALSKLNKLETIYLEYNPLAKEDPLYRKQLAEVIPSLTQIDADPIGATGRAGGGQALARDEELRRLQAVVLERARQETDAKAAAKDA